MFYGGIRLQKKIFFNKNEKQRKDFCMVGTHIGEAEG